MPTLNPVLRDVYTARRRIAAVVSRTPLIPSHALSERAGAEVYLKLENLQTTGSFKLRGATNKLASLSAEERARGVITVSTGNHGRAVAYAARALGTKAVVCLAQSAAPNKVAAIRQLGAEIVEAGKTYDQATERSLELQQERGLSYVDPFDDPHIIAGQGTISLEILEDLPELDSVLVPLSGGGLISGIALALKAASPRIRVIGVAMEAAPVMYHSLRAGRPVTLEEEPTIADALVGGLGVENRYTFRLVQTYVDDTLLVSEEEIAAGMAFALQEHRLVVEGGGAVGIAALLSGRAAGLGERVAVVVSGGNVELPLLLEVARQHIGNGAAAPREAAG